MELTEQTITNILHLRTVHNNMLSRCLNENHTNYARYGGRGITITDAWLKFEAFVLDMLPTYKQGLTIERVNNDLGYCKDNCKWATMTEQNNNRTFAASKDTEVLPSKEFIDNLIDGVWRKSAEFKEAVVFPMNVLKYDKDARRYSVIVNTGALNSLLIPAGYEIKERKLHGERQKKLVCLENKDSLLVQYGIYRDQ